MENYQIDCEFQSPKTWEDQTPTSSDDFWQYSELKCESQDIKIDLIENATTGAEFYLDKSVSYGDFLIIVFLMIFLIFGIMKFLVNFLIPKLMNFKR